MQAPFKGVEIEINHDCNRACAYCPNSAMERKNQGRMSEGLFIRILTQLKELDYQGRLSYHFYNEPLLSPDLDRFVQLTKDFLPKCWIELYSNGTLLTGERLIRLLELGVDKFTVTRHHGVKELPFEDTLQHLTPAQREKIQLQHYKSLVLTSRGGAIKVGKSPENTPLDLPCFIPVSLVIITVNGNVIPCYEDYEEKNMMGNLSHSSLMEIWDSEKYRKFRDDLKKKKRADYPVCRSCNRTSLIT